MIEPLPPELAALLEAERVATGPDAAVQAAVRTRLARSIGSVPLGHVVTGASAKLVTLMVVAVASVGAVVGGYQLSTRGSTLATPIVNADASGVPRLLGAASLSSAASEPVAPAEAVVAAAPPPPPPPPPPPLPPLPPRPATLPAAVPRHVTPPPPASATPPEATPEAPEATLLTEAWQALSAGDASRALAIVDQDAAARPHGSLEEERRALEVAALDALGRRADARADARAFLQPFPRSLHARLVGAVLQPKDPP